MFAKPIQQTKWMWKHWHTFFACKTIQKLSSLYFSYAKNSNSHNWRCKNGGFSYGKDLKRIQKPETCINMKMLPGICNNLCLMFAAVAFCQFLSRICWIWRHNTSFLLYKSFFFWFFMCAGESVALSSKPQFLCALPRCDSKPTV